MSQPPKPHRQLRLEIPNNLNATYSNGAVISQTHSEIIMDFLQIIPNDPRARIQSRIVMTPANAKSLLGALQQNLERYEERHGEIKLPPRPISLADQLFRSVRPDDAAGDEGDEDDSEDDQQDD
jgi:hypothetical protein